MKKQVHESKYQRNSSDESCSRNEIEIEVMMEFMSYARK